MKRILLAAAAVATFAGAGAAMAQPWMTINQRQANLDARIDQGVRDHSLTPIEANNLRAEFRQIANLEAAYRRDGLSPTEMADLDRRFNALSVKINVRRHDQDNWVSINQRQADIEARINDGVRRGVLTAPEAARLRAQFKSLENMEAAYRRDGLSPTERADLDRRFDALSKAVYAQKHDAQNRWDDPWGRGRWMDQRGQWMDINARQARLDARIDEAIRMGRVSRPEAVRLRQQFADIARLEAAYRRDGLSASERADLDRRFDALSANIRIDAR